MHHQGRKCSLREIIPHAHIKLSRFRSPERRLWKVLFSGMGLRIVLFRRNLLPPSSGLKLYREGRSLLQNVGNDLPDYTASHPRRHLHAILKTQSWTVYVEQCLQHWERWGFGILFGKCSVRNSTELMFFVVFVNPFSKCRNSTPN
jgi:hypothetical protein